MCGKNIVASTHKQPRRYTVEATAKNIDKTARTAYEMAEAQRDSFGALAENFAAAQRRSMGLAEGGLEFVKLQEDNARAAQEFFATGAKLLQRQQKNAEFVQNRPGEAAARARARASSATGAKLLQRQQKNAEFVQNWTGDAVEVVREQAEHNARTAEAFARAGRSQQEPESG